MIGKYVIQGFDDVCYDEKTYRKIVANYGSTVHEILPHVIAMSIEDVVTPGAKARRAKWKQILLENFETFGYIRHNLDRRVFVARLYTDIDSEDYVKALSLPDNYYSNVDIDKLFDKLEVVLGTLTEKEQFVIKHYYGLTDSVCLNLLKIGKMMDMPSNRVAQIRAKAMRKLRHPSRYCELPRVFEKHDLRDKLKATVSSIEEMKEKIFKMENELRTTNCKLYSCRNIVDQYFVSTGPLPVELLLVSEIDEETRRERIGSLPLSKRTHACLERAGIDTIEDLLDKYPTLEDFVTIRNLGCKGAEELLRALKYTGLTRVRKPIS